MDKEVILPLMKERKWSVNIEDLLFCESDQHITKVFFINQIGTIDSKYVNLSIGHLTNKLIERGFYRCHRTCLVNMNKVKPYGRYPKLQLNIDTEIVVPLSRRRRQEFHKAYLEMIKGRSHS